MIESENTDLSSIESPYTFDKKSIIKNEICSIQKRNSRKIQIIADLLKDICEEGRSNKEEALKIIKPFISKKIPSISVNDYIERLFKYSKVSEEIFIFVLIYIDRICGNHKICLNYNNIHKLILASFIASIKFNEDNYYSMNYYAKLGGVSKKEIISLEYEFLNLIDFKLFIDEQLFDKYKQNLQNIENGDDDDDDDYEDDY